MQTAPAHTSFALAKIQPPRHRAGLIERPGLERPLGSALRHRRLTLLLAPAGYGKTAALSRQLAQLAAGSSVAWISADEDDHLQRFLACLCAALEPHDLPWRIAPDALATLADTGRGLRDAASELVNALAGSDTPRGLLVVDDAHRITDPRVWELLALALERLPEHWGLVIASRVEPPIALARWRAADELAEFRQPELRFDEGEVAALIGADASATAAERVHELMERTDGWAAGLRLSLAAQPAGGAPRRNDRAQRHLFDYLASEVLAEMPDGLREFLLRCSILPELTAARCAHVSGLPQAAAWLDEVERRGLFVSVLDADETTLRLHDLFRDFLEDRLQRDHPDQLAPLLKRAAEHEPDLARRVGYLTRAGAWDEATGVLAQAAPERLSAGAGTELEQLLALFPPSQFDPRPDLHLVRGLIAWPRFDWDTLLVSMQRAADGYAAAGRMREAGMTRINLCSGLLHAARLAEATRELEAQRALPLDDALRAFVMYCSAWDAFAGARGEEVAVMYGAMLHALEQLPVAPLWHQFPMHCVFIGLPGMQPLLERFCDGALRITGHNPSQLHAGVMHIRSWAALSRGDLADAAHWLLRADEDTRWLGSPRNVLTDNRMTHALLQTLRGDHEAGLCAARALVDDMVQQSPLAHRRVHLSEVLFVHLRAAWIAQDLATVRDLDRALIEAATPYEWVAAPSLRSMSRAFVALADGRLAEAQQALEPLAADVNRSLFYLGTQARVMLADVQRRRGALAAAADTLAPWLDEAAQSGEFAGALLAGASVIDGLATAPWASLLTPPQQALLQRFAVLLRNGRIDAAAAGPADAAATAPASPATRSQPLAAEVLSEREREVLERIAAGDSNKLIARAFDLSPHTVKRHVANILGKIGVDSRGQAAAWWRGRA